MQPHCNDYITWNVVVWRSTCASNLESVTFVSLVVRSFRLLFCFDFYLFGKSCGTNILQIISFLPIKMKKKKISRMHTIKTTLNSVPFSFLMMWSESDSWAPTHSHRTLFKWPLTNLMKGKQKKETPKCRPSDYTCSRLLIIVWQNHCDILRNIW